MYRTLLFTFATTLLLLTNSAFAQKEVEKEEEFRMEGPRFGVDMSRFFLGGLQPADGSGWEIKADIPYQRKYFPTIELGYASIDDKPEGFLYENKGGYARIGVDLNIMEFIGLDDHDILFVGARYGFSRFDHEAYNIETQNPNGTPVWGDIPLSYIPSTSNTAHWGEVVFGMKGEVFRNLFLGWSARVKFMAYSSDKGLKAYYVPGFGFREVDVPVDITYGIYYRLPIWKVKGTSVAKKKKVQQDEKKRQ